MRIIYTTTSSKKEAQDIAQALLERGLIACAQIQKIKSLYRWEGNIVSEKEYLLRLKTTKKNAKAVRKFISQNHSYEIAQIISIKIKSASKAYKKWVKSECALHNKK